MVAAVMVALRWLVSPDIGLYDVGKDTEVNYKAEYERYIQLLDDPGNQRDTTELLTTLNRQVMDPKDLHHLKLPPQESPLPEGKTQKKRKSDDTEIDAENAPPAKRKQKYAYRHKDGATTSKKGVQKNQHWVKDSKRKGKNSKGKGKDNSMDVDQL
ncbi:hypothetical protein FRC17_005750 [Serendipita sp. 399]|nr:hypothetical protein FRC17_005750 [Serendipita sp. 399]